MQKLWKISTYGIERLHKWQPKKYSIVFVLIRPTSLVRTDKMQRNIPLERDWLARKQKNNLLVTINGISLFSYHILEMFEISGSIFLYIVYSCTKKVCIIINIITFFGWYLHLHLRRINDVVMCQFGKLSVLACLSGSTI